MRDLVLTPAAQADLIAIAEFIEPSNGDLETAERFIGRLLEQCRKIASLPVLLGRPRPELLPGVRSVPFAKYLIFIRCLGPHDAPDTVEVLNVLHGSRDIPAFFAKRTGS